MFLSTTDVSNGVSHFCPGGDSESMAAHQPKDLLVGFARMLIGGNKEDTAGEEESPLVVTVDFFDLSVKSLHKGAINAYGAMMKM